MQALESRVLLSASLISTVNPGLTSSITIGNAVYFAGDDGAHGEELWKTDGTAGGTSMVADLNPGSGSSNPYSFFNFNGTLYFGANDGSQYNLYETNGTTAGTAVVYAGGASTLTQVGNVLYFLGGDSNGDTVLYKSDGKATGTYPIKTLVSGPPSFQTPSVSLAGFNGTLYIMVGTTLSRLSPNDSTTVVATVAGSGVGPADMTVLNNEMYFDAGDTANPNKGALWKTNGTAGGTQEVWSSATEGGPSQLLAFGNDLYFYSLDTDNQYDIFTSDGTAAGTVLLTSHHNFPYDFIAAGNKLYFVGPATGYAGSLYETDGTAAGTRVVDPTLSAPNGVQAVGGLLYFVAEASSGGQYELFQTDGTTTQLVDPTEISEGWTPWVLVGQVNGTVLMGASATQGGTQLWSIPTTTSTTARFVKDDTTTGGNWTGAYGGDGYMIIGDQTALPGYVTWNTSGATYYQWAAPGDADGRGPQTWAGSSYHEAGTIFANSSFSVDLDFHDGQPHTVAFYLLDYDSQGRVETVQVSNADSGQVLDSRTVSNFGEGEYLVYTLSGNVTITFTNAGPSNAVLSAIFFGPGGSASPASASFAGTDATTQGRWTGQYGSQGSDLMGSQYGTIPIYYRVTGAPQFYQWATSTTDRRDVQTAPGSSNLVAACLYSYSTPFGFNLDFLDGQTHQVALYLLDWDYLNRNETIQLSNAVTGQVLDTENVTNFSQGKYLRWDVSGDVQITISNNGGLNAVVSGLFIDPTPSASFVKTDSTTMGAYTGIYGKDGYDVINSAQSLPSYASLSFSPSAIPFTWAASTTAASALQDSPGSSSRIAACDYSQNPSFSFNLNLTDGLTHQVALYVLDWDSLNRNETIQISDAHTGKLLDSESVSNFANGKYLVWNLAGDVNVTVVNAGGWNEVLSGIFFN